jgi:hypothetical protein
MKDARQSPQEAETAVSLVRDDPLYRAQRALGLIPSQGLGLLRRAIFYSLFAWAPLALWAVWTNRALPGEVAEPLLAHYAIHVQLLLALPVLILGEGLAHGITTELVPQFVASGVVPEGEVPRFREIIRDVRRLRNSTGPWLVIAVAIVGWLVMPRSIVPMHELTWAEEAAHARRGFGGWWYVYVARPIFLVFLLAWLWRVVLLAVLLQRIARLDLHLAPLHPDRAGGLSFVQVFPRMFAPFAFACSSLLSARWAHEVVYHGAHVASFKVVAIIFAVAMLLTCLAPLAVFIPKLVKVRRRALFEYGALVGKHSWLVHRRWIARDDVAATPLLAAPELGPVADVSTLYEAVQRMRLIPIGKQALLGIALPVLVPLFALFIIEIPLGELLGKIAKGLL